MSIVLNSIYQQFEIKDFSFVRKKQLEIWNQFFFNSFEQEQSNNEIPELRNFIYESWKRCKNYDQIHPTMQGTTKNISLDKIKEIRKENRIFQIAEPILKYAKEELYSINNIVMFSDSDGIILDGYGDLPLARKIEKNVNA